MAFGTIFTIVIIGYILLYGGMIIYDLFFKKSAADLIPKPEDEDIDISDEARQFHPIIIEKECKLGNGKKNGKRADPLKSCEKEVKDGKPVSEESQDEPPPQAMVLEDEEPTNRRSLNDIGNRAEQNTSTPLTDEEKERLEKLSLIKEEKLRNFRGEDKPNTNTTEPPKVDTSSQGEESDTQSQEKEDVEEPQKPVPKKRQYESARKEMPVPEGHKANTFEPTVRIPDDTGQTKICNGQTVEDLHEEVKKTLADDLEFAKKALESLWVRTKNELEEPVSEEDILRPPEQEDGTARQAATFVLPT